MSTKRKKSDAIKFLEKITGGPQTFGRMLRAIRLGEEQTLKEFAAKLSLSIPHLSDIENERRTVSPERAAKFASMLGYPEGHFIELALQDLLNQSGLPKFRVRVS